MDKYRTDSAKKDLCDEFIAKNCTYRDFCKEMGIGLSTLRCYLYKFNYLTKKNNSKLQALRLKNNNVLLNPIQIALPNGIKINVPPNFCNDSLKSILSSLEVNDA